MKTKQKRLADAILPLILATLWPGGPNKPGANLLPFSMVVKKRTRVCSNPICGTVLEYIARYSRITSRFDMVDT